MKYFANIFNWKNVLVAILLYCNSIYTSIDENGKRGFDKKYFYKALMGPFLAKRTFTYPDVSPTPDVKVMGETGRKKEYVPIRLPTGKTVSKRSLTEILAEFSELGSEDLGLMPRLSINESNRVFPVPPGYEIGEVLNNEINDYYDLASFPWFRAFGKLKSYPLDEFNHPTDVENKNDSFYLSVISADNPTVTSENMKETTFVADKVTTVQNESISGRKAGSRNLSVTDTGGKINAATEPARNDANTKSTYNATYLFPNSTDIPSLTSDTVQSEYNVTEPDNVTVLSTNATTSFLKNASQVSEYNVTETTVQNNTVQDRNASAGNTSVIATGEEINATMDSSQNDTNAEPIDLSTNSSVTPSLTSVTKDSEYNLTKTSFDTKNATNAATTFLNNATQESEYNVTETTVQNDTIQGRNVSTENTSVTDAREKINATTKSFQNDTSTEPTDNNTSLSTNSTEIPAVTSDTTKSEYIITGISTQNDTVQKQTLDTGNSSAPGTDKILLIDVTGETSQNNTNEEPPVNSTQSSS